MPPKSVLFVSKKDLMEKFEKSEKRAASSDDDDQPIRPMPKKPAMPESDVVLAKSSSSHAVSEKYWFIRKHSRSYTQNELDEIRRIAVAEQLSDDQTTCMKCRAQKETSGSFPPECVHWVQQFIIGDPKFKCRIEISFESMKLPFRNGFILDKSRTAGDTVCSLSCEEYQQPHLLNVTGRSYSRVAIESAINASLVVGKPLILEDCIIHPCQLHMLSLYPNHGLNGWDLPLTWIMFGVNLLSDSLVFDPKRCESNNIEEASKWFNDKEGNKIIPSYRMRRGVEFENTQLYIGYTFCDLIIKDIVFGRWITHYATSIFTTFSNVWFQDCVIHVFHEYPIVFVACKFERCIFVVDGHARAPLKRCHNPIMTRCAFVVQSDTYAIALESTRTNLANRCKSQTMIPSGTISVHQMETMSKYDIMHRVAVAAGFQHPMASDGDLTFKTLTADNVWKADSSKKIGKPFP